ncbi:MAG: hypothetical protein CMK50_03765 [Propionibacteriaceae bacterium]|nr:hypothetical protein [Propionibacteriaceae bacterium]
MVDGILEMAHRTGMAAARHLFRVLADELARRTRRLLLTDCAVVVCCVLIRVFRAIRTSTKGKGRVRGEAFTCPALHPLRQAAFLAVVCGILVPASRACRADAHGGVAVRRHQHPRAALRLFDTCKIAVLQLGLVRILAAGSACAQGLVGLSR